MENDGYQYKDMIASTWDLWRDNTANWADRSFYLDIVRQYGEPVLDVGCGTGRILLDFQAQGIDIDGLDNSPEMLSICRQKAEKIGLQPVLYLQSMDELDLPRRYRTIVIPSSSLQLVTETRKVQQAMLRFYAHLEPGGALITPFSFDWREGEPLDRGWELLFEKTRPEDGAVVRSWTHEWVEPEEQLWHTDQRFEIEKEGRMVHAEEHRTSPEGRWYSQEQAEALFQLAGFENIQLFHELTREPASPEDHLFCVLGVKPDVEKQTR